MIVSCRCWELGWQVSSYKVEADWQLQVDWLDRDTSAGNVITSLPVFGYTPVRVVTLTVYSWRLPVIICWGGTGDTSSVASI